MLNQFHVFNSLYERIEEKAEDMIAFLNNEFSGMQEEKSFKRVSNFLQIFVVLREEKKTPKSSHLKKSPRNFFSKAQKESKSAASSPRRSSGSNSPTNCITPRGISALFTKWSSKESGLSPITSPKVSPSHSDFFVGSKREDFITKNGYSVDKSPRKSLPDDN